MFEPAVTIEEVRAVIVDQDRELATNHIGKELAMIADMWGQLMETDRPIKVPDFGQLTLIDVYLAILETRRQS